MSNRKLSNADEEIHAGRIKLRLSDVATFVEEKVSSEDISLLQYVTTDSLLQNKAGRTVAQNLPPQKCSLTSFKKGDVLLGNIRPYLKKIWYANIDGGCSQDVLVLRAKENKNSSFLYALLSQDSFFEYEMKATKGSKMPRGDKNHIMNFPCLDLKNKIGIGNFLSLLDKKIALNSRINARLEQMSKRLYDYWFVQYDFPNENGKPYKSSGGKMAYNAELKREIPDGWGVTSLKDCISHINTGLNPRDNFKLGNGTIKYITVKNLTENGNIDFSNCDIIDENARELVHNRSEISIGDILFASICPLGRCYLIRTEPKTWDINESVFSIRPNSKKITSQFLYCILKDSYYINKMSQTATGSIFKGIRINDLEKLLVLLPSRSLINLFTQKTIPIFNYQLSIEQESAKLIALRDNLLPLLMNGQVEMV